MNPQPSPDAATLRQRSSADLTYLPGSTPPPPPHAEPEHRVTASRAAHLPLISCGAPQTMAPSREEVRGEGAQGVSEKEETREFWAGQILVRSSVRYGRPQLPLQEVSHTCQLIIFLGFEPLRRGLVEAAAASSFFGGFCP